ncbi:hypothetical protein IW262DRAFT_150886 [Armillaria fumosa]|nr:hypothetical protein IW262DRAFT_150886 [Armillaria fumosa]
MVPGPIIRAGRRKHTPLFRPLLIFYHLITCRRLARAGRGDHGTLLRPLLIGHRSMTHHGIIRARRRSHGTLFLPLLICHHLMTWLGCSEMRWSTMKLHCRKMDRLRTISFFGGSIPPRHDSCFCMYRVIDYCITDTTISLPVALYIPPPNPH